jgi:molecular chaperone GrpE (heat shock protein)
VNAAADGDATPEALLERLDALADLFKRRLLDDRVKQGVIEDLQARLDRAERAASVAALKPFVDSLALVIERLQSAEPSASLVLSIVSELEYILEAVVGVTTISAEVDEPVERLRHEVASVFGEGSKLRVAELIRVGYEKDGVVLRPAVIAACRTSDDAGGEAGGDA